MNMIKNFLKDESGMGAVEIILIIVVLIGLVVMFKDKIEKLSKAIFESIESEAKKIY